MDPSVEVESHTVLAAALVRGFGLAVAGVFVAVLFERQVEITRELDELEATRDALRPSAIAPRPALDLAAHYVPVQDGVGGDFYLAVEGPRGSTVLVVGDVVGKGVTAAAASRVRAHVAGDLRPVRGRPRAAAAAGQRGADRPRRHLRGLRDGGLRRPPPGGRDARLGAGRPSRAARARLGPRARPARPPGPPLGLDHDLEVAAASHLGSARTTACCSTRTGSSTRATPHGARFGEERLSALVADYQRRDGGRAWWSI